MLEYEIGITLYVKITNKKRLPLCGLVQHPNIRTAYNKQIYGYLVFRISRISTTLFLLKKLLIISQLCRVANGVVAKAQPITTMP